LKQSNKLISFRYSKRYFINTIRHFLNKKTFKGVKLNSHSHCPLCSSKEIIKISEVDRIGFFCDTVVCGKCQLLFNNNFVSNPDFYYSKIWGTQRWISPEKNFKKRIAGNSFAFNRFFFVEGLLKNKFEKIKTVFEIGCGDGCNLYPYHRSNKEVFGFDYDMKFLEPGINTGMNLSTKKEVYFDKKYDLILSIHSLEHMINIDKQLENIVKMMKESSYLYIEVPGVYNNNLSYGKTLSEMGLRSSNNFLAYLQFQHNYHFTLDTLNAFCARNGLELIYGDEWVRAIFVKSDRKSNFKNKNNNVDIIRHLKKAELDFLNPIVLSKKFFYRFFS